MAAKLLSGDAVLAGWERDLAAGVAPRRFPVADPDSPLAGIEVAPGLVTLFGGAPYGMTTTSDSDGSRQPSAQELEGARFQGKRVAEIAAKLHG